jgi:2-dehydropantoate 2-reductase
MTAAPRRYVVVGAGAVGGTIGGRLALAGRDVLLVARGAHGEAVRRSGLRLRDPGGESTVPIACVATPAEVAWREGDVAVLATKVQQAAVALDDLAAAAPPSTPVLCATNGLEGERLALRRFANTYAIVVMLPAEHLQPGVVTAYSAPVLGTLDIGRYPNGADELAADVATDFEAAGFASRADADVMRRKRQKLFLNLANVLEAACGRGTDVGDLYATARAEAEAAMRAAGLTWASDEEDRARREESGMGMRPVAGERRQGGSTWQSLARGTGETEADYLNGEIVLLGRLHGVPTPVNAMLQRVARELATSGEPPGSRTPADLRRACSAN